MAKEQEIDDIKLIYKIIKIRLHNLITGINIDEDEKIIPLQN